MKEKPILPLLLSMAAPMILSMLVNSLYNIIDSIFVAKISEDAMTALSLVFPIQNVVNSVAVGFGIGINVMIAFCLGADQREQADKAASQGMFLSIVHGIILSITGILIMPSFLKLFTNNQDNPLAMDDFDAAVQQRMERLQSYIDLIRTAEAVEEEVKVKGTKLYLGPEDVAAYLNCSIPTARQYMHRPGFPLIQLGENGTKLAVFAPAFHAYNAGKY